jgi:hypothetical protein
MKVFTAFLDLLAANASIPREKLWRHLQKIKTPQYLRDIIQTCTQDAYTFSLMGTKIISRLRPTEAWNRAALCVPFCIPFITMTWTDSWLYREVLPLPWIQLKSLTVIMLTTLLSLQIRLKVCNSNWTNLLTMHVSKGSIWTLTKQKLWSSSAGVTLRFPRSRTYQCALREFREETGIDGTPLKLVTEYKYLGITLTRDGSMLTAAKKMADNFRSAIACQSLQNWW